MLGRDIRYAWRVLLKSPAFTATAIVTLAVAIGVNIAVFTLVNSVFLSSLPYPDPDGLALVSRHVVRGTVASQDQSVDGRTWQLVHANPSVGASAVFSSWTTGANLVVRDASGADTAAYVQQQRVGAGFFGVLGVAPAMGREFTPDEDRRGGPSAVILNADLWRTAFGADRDIIGRVITLRGEPFIAVGVMPAGFRSGVEADVWTPLRPSTTGEGAGENYSVLVRLASQSNRAEAIATLSRIGDELRAERPGTTDGTNVSFGLISLQDGLTENLRRPILMLWAAVAVVLIAAAVNLAGLMLARTSRRAREIATRVALGSSRVAVVRQLLVEATILGVVGGGAGILVGAMSVDALTWLVRGTYDIGQLPGLGPRSVALAGLLSIAASLVFGLGPALYASRSSVQAAGIASQSAARSVAGSPGRKPRLALVAAQFALSVTLLVAAGLLLRAFVHLRNLEPGFDPNHLVAASVSLEDARYRSVDRVMRLADEGLARLAQSPGVDSAALSLGVPYERLLNLGFRFADAGSAGTDARGEMTSATYVTPGFFETMKIPVRRGRTFDARDSSTASPAVVVNEAFARTYLRGAEIIGRRIRLAGAERQIIGVVGDVQVKPGWGEHGPLAAMPLTYLPLTQVNDGLARLVHGWFLPTFVVRSSLPPAQTAASLRQALASVDPLLPLATIRTMFEIRAAALSSQRLLMTLLLALALATVVVAAIGIHGLIASSVTERTREMGIRVALGATSADALRALAMPGVALAAISTVLGLLCAMVVVRFLRHFVWGISINDPVTFACVGLFLLSVGAVASVVPALRILRLDPAITLRGEL